MRGQRTLGILSDACWRIRSRPEGELPPRVLVGVVVDLLGRGRVGVRIALARDILAVELGQEHRVGWFAVRADTVTRELDPTRRRFY